MSIHKLIRDGRARLRLTEQEFANKVGVSRGAVQQWEKEGGTAPTRKNQPTVAALLELSVSQLMGGSLDPESGKQTAAIDLTNNHEYPSIRRVRFRLSAGASGFAVEYDGEDTSPIVFQRKWFDGHSYIPGKLFAARVANGSMEPGLYHDDTVVVNTADTTLKDGEVFAMNYEGELVIKRLIRDAGQWWLASDNPDQRRYPRKVCGDNVFCVGRIVHKQSEKI